MSNARFKVGDVVVTKESVVVYTHGKRSGKALVGWKWVIDKVIPDKKIKAALLYMLKDQSGVYEAVVHEGGIWKKWDDLSESQKNTAMAGKEVVTQ